MLWAVFWLELLVQAQPIGGWRVSPGSKPSRHFHNAWWIWWVRLVLPRSRWSSEEDQPLPTLADLQRPGSAGLSLRYSDFADPLKGGCSTWWRSGDIILTSIVPSIDQLDIFHRFCRWLSTSFDIFAAASSASAVAPGSQRHPEIHRERCLRCDLGRSRRWEDSGCGEIGEIFLDRFSPCPHGRWEVWICIYI